MLITCSIFSFSFACVKPSNYMKDEEHVCYLCEKCGKYTEELREHCKMCCICNKYNTDIRTNGKCGVCYYIK